MRKYLLHIYPENFDAPLRARPDCQSCGRRMAEWNSTYCPVFTLQHAQSEDEAAQGDDFTGLRLASSQGRRLPAIVIN